MGRKRIDKETPTRRRKEKKQRDPVFKTPNKGIDYIIC